MNLSHVARFLPKGMVLGYAMPHPTRIVRLVDEAGKSPKPPAEVGTPAETAFPHGPDEDGAASKSWKDVVDLSHLEPIDTGNKCIFF